MAELVRITRGVWRRASYTDDVGARVAAILSAMPEASVVAGLTAAALYGLWLPSLVRGTKPVEVVLHPDAPQLEAHAGSRRAEVRARRRRLWPDEVVRIGGLPATSPARTWLDLAECLPMPDLVAVGDSALRTGASEQVLAMVVSRGVHRRGVRRARAALPLLDGRSRSRPESHLR